MFHASTLAEVSPTHSSSNDGLRLVIESSKAPVLHDTDVQFQVSIGVSSLDSNDDTLEVLLNRAENALYAAKNADRNCVSAYRNLVLVN
jgi:diguanylate cyclase (GGDEF)-like protein